jgi:hypothetical protein
MPITFRARVCVLKDGHGTSIKGAKPISCTGVGKTHRGELTQAVTNALRERLVGEGAPAP